MFVFDDFMQISYAPSDAYDRLALTWSAPFIAFINPTTSAQHHLQTPVVKPTMRSLIPLLRFSAEFVQNPFISRTKTAVAEIIKPRSSLKESCYWGKYNDWVCSGLLNALVELNYIAWFNSSRPFWASLRRCGPSARHNHLLTILAGPA